MVVVGQKPKPLGQTNAVPHLLQPPSHHPTVISTLMTDQEHPDIMVHDTDDNTNDQQPAASTDDLLSAQRGQFTVKMTVLAWTTLPGNPNDPILINHFPVLLAGTSRKREREPSIEPQTPKVSSTVSQKTALCSLPLSIRAYRPTNLPPVGGRRTRGYRPQRTKNTCGKAQSTRTSGRNRVTASITSP